MEYQRDQYLHQHSSEKLNQSTDNLKKFLHDETTHRLKLTTIYYNRKHEINILGNSIEQYSYLVKDQREKIINYEKLNDQWILNLNINRKRLLEIFQRINQIDEYINNTKTFLQQFDQIKFTLRSNILIFYHKINRFIQQRREKNDDNKNSLNTKYFQLKQIFQINQKLFNQIKQNIIILDKNSSILFNQISKINKQKFDFIELIDILKKKFFIKQQQIFNSLNQFYSIKQFIDLNKKKFQQISIEKQNISSFLLEKQHLIIIFNRYINSNNNILIKHQLSYNKLNNKIQQIRKQILNEIQQNKSVDKHQHQINLKQKIGHLRKELFEYKKKTNQIHRRHITQQILTNFDKKSILKGIDKYLQDVRKVT